MNSYCSICGSGDANVSQFACCRQFCHSSCFQKQQIRKKRNQIGRPCPFCRAENAKLLLVAPPALKKTTFKGEDEVVPFLGTLPVQQLLLDTDEFYHPSDVDKEEVEEHNNRRREKKKAEKMRVGPKIIPDLVPLVEPSKAQLLQEIEALKASLEEVKEGAKHALKLPPAAPGWVVVPAQTKKATNYNYVVADGWVFRVSEGKKKSFWCTEVPEGQREHGKRREETVTCPARLRKVGCGPTSYFEKQGEHSHPK